MARGKPSTPLILQRGAESVRRLVRGTSAITSSDGIRSRHRESQSAAMVHAGDLTCGTTRLHHLRMARTQRKAVARDGRDAPSHAKHLTASMRVLRAHLHRPALTARDAHDAVKELALQLGTGESTADDLRLEDKLKKATGESIAELAKHAEGWPNTPWIWGGHVGTSGATNGP